MSTMKTHWTALTRVENVATQSQAAAMIKEDLEELFSPAVRVMFILFEKDKWRASSVAGRRALATMLAGLPDTKCVEDTHQHFRDLHGKVGL